MIDVVQTGQRCMTCGYLLDGQAAFVREDFAIVLTRCPECGLSQPVGAERRWAGRAERDVSRRLWRWALSLLFMTVSIAGAVFGLAQSTGYAAVYPLADWIVETSGMRSRSGIASARWWVREGKAALADQGLSPWALVDWSVAWDLLWALPIGWAAGVWFQARLMHADRRGRVAAWALTGGLSLAGLATYLVVIDYWLATRTGDAVDLAVRVVGWMIALGAWVVIWGVVTLGMAAGRPVLRGVVVLWGGPRQRAWASPLFESR